MTRYQLRGAAFPVDPLAKRWSRRQVATGGTGEAIYSAFWQVEFSFGILSKSEVEFFMDALLDGGLINLTTTHPKTGELATFTGTNIADFTYTRNDIESDSWAEDGRLVISHISLSATGTV